MKQLRIFGLAVAMAIGTVQISAAQAPPPPDFGSPPSGEVPLLFNDHHVYSKPDTLKQGRVLAALVQGSTILVPLRSMFEQMGGTVAYDGASKTATVSKPGSEIKVTVGKPEALINGESRPLDVPPIIYKGEVLVPVRVISETMGAYVQWLPDKHVVVVRYIPPTPPPPPPTPPPTPKPIPKPKPSPTPTPTPTPVPVIYEKFVAGDYLISAQTYNEFSPGNKLGSYDVRGAIEFPLFNLPWMIGADWRTFQYAHNTSYGGTTGPPTYFNIPNGTPCIGAPDALGPGGAAGDQGCVTTIGAQSQVYVNGFVARNSDLDVHFGLKVLDPRVYVEVAYLWRNNNYGYPTLRNVGVGLEKLPDLNNAFTVYGNVYYFFNVNGSYVDPNTPAGVGTSYGLSYNILKYSVGLDYSPIPQLPVFLDAGVLGDTGTGRSNAPSNFRQFSPYVGLGIHF